MILLLILENSKLVVRHLELRSLFMDYPALLRMKGRKKHTENMAIGARRLVLMLTLRSDYINSSCFIDIC